MTLDVDTDVLRAHAAELDRIAESAREAVDAGRHVAVQGDAFGRICAFIGTALAPVQVAGVAAAREATAAVEVTGHGVRGVAGGFDLAERVVVDGLARLRDEVGEHPGFAL
ncbi:type VII secretion target [Nocardioides pacificus]